MKSKEALEIEKLTSRINQLNDWIASVDPSVPELVMDIKFWREEIAEIRKKLEKFCNYGEIC